MISSEGKWPNSVAMLDYVGIHGSETVVPMKQRQYKKKWNNESGDNDVGPVAIKWDHCVLSYKK